MSETILITSGKGGVGKSTVCTMLGVALARRGNRVLMIETDCGLRNLDIMNGVEDRAVYDLGDVLLGQCEPIKAIIGSRLHPGLFLLPATNHTSCIPRQSGLERLLDGLEEYYDTILVDCPAGLGGTLEAVMSIASRGLVVVTPQLIPVKDGAKAAQLLVDRGLTRSRLVINRVPRRFRPTPALPDLDAVIDQVGLQLVGVVPEDSQMSECVNNGRECPPGAVTQVFDNIARRLAGELVPLRIE